MDEKLYSVLMEIKTDVATVKAQMQNVSSQLANHENRIVKLEQPAPAKEDTFKNDILKLLAKALVIALAVIGSLTGASALINQILQK